MQITKDRLKQIIKEELTDMNENEPVVEQDSPDAGFHQMLVDIKEDLRLIKDKLEISPSDDQSGAPLGGMDDENL
tara:strand:+ start:659 stop:883 length:225 start_codon:yes stop_codon:yes gene_type:complete